MLAQELNSLLKENISSRGPAQALFEVRREMTILCSLNYCCRARSTARLCTAACI
jgi:hypothetical protein